MIPALKAIMEPWVYYIGFMKMRDISERISIVEEDIYSNKSLQELLQQKFFNGLVVGIYDGNPQWYELAIKHYNPDDEQMIEELEGTIGILKLDGSETLFTLNGQHQVESIRKAITRNPDLKTGEVSVIFVKS